MMKIQNFYPSEISSSSAIVLASGFVVLFANYRFLTNTLAVYSLESSSMLFIGSIAVLL